MASALDVWNAALAALGQTELSSLEDAGTVARTCRSLWTTVRPDIIRRHPWNCLVKRVTLSPQSDAPPHSWKYWALLPEDFARMLSFGLDDEACREPHQIEHGRRILANTSTFRLRYVADRPEAEWDANLISVAVAAMCRDLAYPITKSTSLLDVKTKDFERALKQAKAIDAQENPSETIETESPLIAARLGRARAWERT